jgi:hypothetical protein
MKTVLSTEERMVVSLFKKYNDGYRALSRQTLELIPAFSGRQDQLSVVLEGLHKKGILSPIYDGAARAYASNFNMTSAGRAILSDPTL